MSSLLRYLWLGYLIPTIQNSEEMLDSDFRPSVYSGKKPFTHKGLFIRLAWLGIQFGGVFHLKEIPFEDTQGYETQEVCKGCGQGHLSVNKLGEKWCTRCSYFMSVFDE